MFPVVHDNRLSDVSRTSLTPRVLYLQHNLSITAALTSGRAVLPSDRSRDGDGGDFKLGWLLIEVIDNLSEA